MRVIGFEDEADFLVSKHLEGMQMKHSIRELKQPERSSISFQGTKQLGRHSNRFRAGADATQDTPEKAV
jgi:hypothetical protein